MPDYPSTFRLPEWTPYNLEVDMGVIRTRMETGKSRQRRRYNNMPTLMNLTFVMTWKQLRVWQNWWNSVAYEWFDMPAISAYSEGKQDCDTHNIRCISNLNISISNVRGYCIVTCVVEINEEMHTGFPNLITGWIRAGSAANPSSPDLYKAGSPGNPSPDWVIAGTPDNPSPVV